MPHLDLRPACPPLPQIQPTYTRTIPDAACSDAGARSQALRSSLGTKSTELSTRHISNTILESGPIQAMQLKRGMYAGDTLPRAPAFTSHNWDDPMIRPFGTSMSMPNSVNEHATDQFDTHQTLQQERVEHSQTHLNTLPRGPAFTSHNWNDPMISPFRTSMYALDGTTSFWIQLHNVIV